MTDSADPSSTPTAPPSGLSDVAIGAVVALIGVAELYDPAAAHRSALRAIVAERIFAELSTPSPQTSDQAPVSQSDRQLIVAVAALADVNLPISRPTNPGEPHAPARPMDSALLMGGLGGLENPVGLDGVATALRSHCERWDGSGNPTGSSGTLIPLAARISALVGALVGNPGAGLIPSWDQALAEVQRQAGTALDPSLSSLAARLDLTDTVAIVAAQTPSAIVQRRLGGSSAPKTTEARVDAESTAPSSQLAPTEQTSPVSTTAATIRSAVGSAADPSALLGLFAKSALQTARAAEIVVMSSTSTQIDVEPVVVVNDGGEPLPPLSRLDDLFEFSTQAELRAGRTLTRDRSGNGELDEVATPIMTGSEAWGVMVASRRVGSPGFERDSGLALRHIASEMADALAKTDHWVEMERMALRDQLTGLGNRHELYRVLDSIFLRPVAERTDTALIMCDVDGLKVVNDSLGHHAGDRLLIDAAEALKGAVRAGDRTTVCRIGGDEFCMVIDGGALLSAYEISDTIERLFERSAGSGLARSISCGIAFADDSVTSRSALLRAADENQYETKRTRKGARSADVSPGDSVATEAESGGRRARRE